MIAYILRRIVLAIPVMIGILFLTFLLSRLIPGDPCRAMLGEKATKAVCDAFIERTGLNQTDSRAIRLLFRARADRRPGRVAALWPARHRHVDGTAAGHHRVGAAFAARRHYCRYDIRSGGRLLAEFPHRRHHHDLCQPGRLGAYFCVGVVGRLSLCCGVQGYAVCTAAFRQIAAWPDRANRSQKRGGWRI